MKKLKMTIYKALKILETKENYIVPNSEFDEALEISINFIKETIENKSD